MADAVVDFLMGNLKHILSHIDDVTLEDKAGIESHYEDLEYIRAFLYDSEGKCNDHEELQRLVARIRLVACRNLHRTEFLISKGFFRIARIRLFIDEIKAIKTKVMDIYSNNVFGIGLHQIGPSSTTASLPRLSSPTVGDEDDTLVVGFNDEATTIMDRLAGERKQLDVISIVGMGGIGKTTLAKKVYSDRYTVSHFYIRGWTSVSQEYRKSDLLLRILSSVVQNEDEIKKLREESLGEELYRQLKGKRYLIVVDDIWSLGAWDDLNKSFPDDRNRSRIIITTRLRDVALQINPNSFPLSLPFLTEDESWNLLRRKVFGKESSCTLELMEIGKQIAAKCKGLPLAIVVIAGILVKKDTKQDSWKQIAESVSSIINNDSSGQFMGILALSYEHLPLHLKYCFLYFGEFPEDFEIPLWKLIRLWIAEGFVRKMGERSLEDIAEDYLIDLKDRSLVLVSMERSKGGVKACRVHDMLHDLCLTKAKEKKFRDRSFRFRGVALAPPSTMSDDPMCFHSHGFHVVSAKPCAPNVPSLFWYASMEICCPKKTNFIFKYLWVLDLGCIYLKNFPNEIFQLFHLRYLELFIVYLKTLLPEISNLWNLETLVIKKGWKGAVMIPHTIWNMVKLRHMHISRGIKFKEPCTNVGYQYPSVLETLQFVSALHLCRSREHTELVLARMPNLRKLTLYRRPNEQEEISFPDLSNVIHLDTLKLRDKSMEGLRLSIPQASKLPPNLKKLTLSYVRLDWNEISNLGNLPNLEVLKLVDNFVSGPRWETTEGEFLTLRYLKLSSTSLQHWITSSNHFPNLQKLVLLRCKDLEEIPSCLGNILTLQMIDVSWPSYTAAVSAAQILEEQHDLGNNELKLSILPNVKL